jgi:hypothetical protein
VTERHINFLTEKKMIAVLIVAAAGFVAHPKPIDIHPTARPAPAVRAIHIGPATRPAMTFSADRKTVGVHISIPIGR